MFDLFNIISFFRVIPLPFITTTVGLLWLLVLSTFMLHYVFVQAYIVLSCLFNIHQSICCPSIMLSSFAFSSVSKKQLPTYIDARGYAQFYCNFFLPWPSLWPWLICIWINYSNLIVSLFLTFTVTMINKMQCIFILLTFNL